METASGNVKRLIAVRLDEGEDLLLSLKRCAEGHGIRAGWFSLLGGLKEFSFGLYADGKHRAIKRSAKAIFELLSMVGNISIKESGVLIHAHIIAADEEDGRAFGGHLLEGSIVCPLVEGFIQECDIPIVRGFNERSNLWHMEFPNR